MASDVAVRTKSAASAAAVPVVDRSPLEQRVEPVTSAIWPRKDYSRVPYRLYHDPSVYQLGWALSYVGNTHPILDQDGPGLLPGTRVLLKLYYDQGNPKKANDQTIHFTACTAVGVPAHCKGPLP